MLNFLNGIDHSLGISQNAQRFQTQLSNELNIQSQLIGRIISGSARLAAVGLASAIIGLFALAVTVALVYQLLLPQTGSTGALAIVAGVLALSTFGLILVALRISKNLPKLRGITIPPIYVPVQPVDESPARPQWREEAVPNSNGASPTSTHMSDQLTDFLMSEARNQFYKSSLDRSIKNFATSFFARDSDQLGKDAIHGLEQQLAGPGVTKKYAILAAAVAAGFLMSRRSN
jgi:LPXTG-motif cell wall-anchored protein